MSPREFCTASLTISHISKTLCLHNQALNPKLTHREPANILHGHSSSVEMRNPQNTDSFLKYKFAINLRTNVPNLLLSV